LPELIRELDEEPVVLTLQASEREGVVGAERRAVAEEGDGPGRRRVGREEIDAEAVGLALPDRLAADEDGRAGPGVGQRVAPLGAPLADRAEEERARRLVLEPRAWEQRRRELGAVPDPGDPLVGARERDADGRVRPERERAGHAVQRALGALVEDRRTLAADGEVGVEVPVRGRFDPEPEAVAGDAVERRVGAQRAAVVDLVAQVRLGVEDVELARGAGVDLPPAAEPDGDAERLVALDRGAAAEIVVAPEPRRVEVQVDPFDKRARRAVEAEAVEGPELDNPGPADEAGVGPEIVVDAVQPVVEAPVPARPVEFELPDRGGTGPVLGRRRGERRGRGRRETR